MSYKIVIFSVSRNGFVIGAVLRDVYSNGFVEGQRMRNISIARLAFFVLKGNIVTNSIAYVIRPLIWQRGSEQTVPPLLSTVKLNVKLF